MPRTVLIPVGGVLSDRIGHRRLMLYADAARCALVATTGASTAAFAVDAASFAVSALTLAMITRERVSGSPADERPSKQGLMAVLRKSRPLQVILVVVVAANLAGGGMGEVALPSLAHARYGAAGYGALLACLAAGSVIGTLAAARAARPRTPAVFAGTVFLTVTQRQVPPALLGRVMGAIMLCAFGSFPLSVAVTRVLVRHTGDQPFFPIAGGMVAAAVLGGLTQRDFRDFGAGEPPPAP